MNIQEYLLNTYPSGSYFVEAGAHDGIGDSQTYALEEAGWVGLCVEPSSAFKGLRRNRKCKVDDRCLYVASRGQVVFREVHGNAIELSGILSSFKDYWDRETRPHTDRLVDTVGLTEMLEYHRAPQRIEFLSLDTEGSELQILTSHNFNRYRFLTILVEHNGVIPNRNGLNALLVHEGYERIYDSEIDSVFVYRGMS